jgi:hypothetical protein
MIFEDFLKMVKNRNKPRTKPQPATALLQPASKAQKPQLLR